MQLKLNIIGCGRLGKTLAFLLKKTGRVLIQDICNSRFSNAKKAVAFLAAGTACPTLKQFRCADLYLIATPDDAIATVCKQLVRQAAPKAESLIFHCSGLLSSDSLESASALGCHTASVHPLFSFANPVTAVKNFSGTYCALEGSAQALEIISPLISSIEGEIFFLKKELKALYHVACVFSSNYVVALSAMAEECHQKSGLPNDIAKMLTQKLMTQTINNLEDTSASKALTGPIQRGDTETIKKHLQALKPYSQLRETYQKLGKATLPLTTLPPEVKKALRLFFE